MTVGEERSRKIIIIITNSVELKKKLLWWWKKRVQVVAIVSTRSFLPKGNVTPRSTYNEDLYYLILVKRFTMR